MIRKTFEAVETKAIDADNGLFECIFSATNNLDRQGDVIDPGAFTKALVNKASVPVVYAHVWNDINQVLGRTQNWKELPPGSPELPTRLLAKGLGGVKTLIQYEMGVPAGRVAATHTKNRNITEWSFAFDIDEEGEKFEDNARHIKSIREVFEVTLALVGANPETQTMAFKSLVEAEAAKEVAPEVDEYEAALADLLEVASQAIDAHVTAVVAAKPDDEAIYRAALARLLSEFSAPTETPSVPVNAKALGDDDAEPDFGHFLRRRQPF